MEASGSRCQQGLAARACALDRPPARGPVLLLGHVSVTPGEALPGPVLWQRLMPWLLAAFRDRGLGGPAHDHHGCLQHCGGTPVLLWTKVADRCTVWVRGTNTWHCRILERVQFLCLCTCGGCPGQGCGLCTAPRSPGCWVRAGGEYCLAGRTVPGTRLATSSAWPSAPERTRVFTDTDAGDQAVPDALYPLSAWLWVPPSGSTGFH